MNQTVIHVARPYQITAFNGSVQLHSKNTQIKIKQWQYWGHSYVAIGNPNPWCRNMKRFVSHFCFTTRTSELNSTLLSFLTESQLFCLFLTVLSLSVHFYPLSLSFAPSNSLSHFPYLSPSALSPFSLVCQFLWTAELKLPFSKSLKSSKTGHAVCSAPLQWRYYWGTTELSGKTLLLSTGEQMFADNDVTVRRVQHGLSLQEVDDNDTNIHPSHSRRCGSQFG